MMNKVWNALWWVVIILCVTFSASEIYQAVSGEALPTVLGIGKVLVETGSMEPTVPTHSLVIINTNEEIEVGDIAMYTDDSGEFVLHRVVAIDGDEVTFKGDANNANDMPVKMEDVVGTAASIGGIYLIFPLLGKIAFFIAGMLSNVYGIIFAVCFVISVMLLVYIFVGDDDEKDNSDKSNKNIPEDKGGVVCTERS